LVNTLIQGEFAGESEVAVRRRRTGSMFSLLV